MALKEITWKAKGVLESEYSSDLRIVNGPTIVQARSGPKICFRTKTWF